MRQEVDPEANIIVGATFDETLGDRVRVSIVASGMARVERAEPAPAAPRRGAGAPHAGARAKPLQPPAKRRRARAVSAAPADAADDEDLRRRLSDAHRHGTRRRPRRPPMRAGRDEQPRPAAARSLAGARQCRHRGRALAPRLAGAVRASPPRRRTSRRPQTLPRRSRRRRPPMSARRRAACPTSTTFRRRRSASIAPRSARGTPALGHARRRMPIANRRMRRVSACCSESRAVSRREATSRVERRQLARQAAARRDPHRRRRMAANAERGVRRRDTPEHRRCNCRCFSAATAQVESAPVSRASLDVRQACVADGNTV